MTYSKRVNTDGAANCKRAALKKLFPGTNLSCVRELKAGGNSRIFYVQTEDDQEYAIKFYSPHKQGINYRLQNERNALQFLHDQGERRIPRVINSNLSENTTVLNWISGETVNDISDKDINLTIEFMQRLQMCALTQDARKLPAAAEACLSPLDLFEQIDARRDILRKQAYPHPALQEFLLQRFDSSYHRLQARAKKVLMDANIKPDKRLLDCQMTLSPSDFGMHNTLRTSRKELVFVDFEYFGWDDPVKLVADFIWHPAMQLSSLHKTLFINKASGLYQERDGSFLKRLHALFPLFGLRWVLILLNEFLPGQWEKRARAYHYSPAQRPAIQLRQLNKATCLLDSIEARVAESENFIMEINVGNSGYKGNDGLAIA